MVAFGAICLQSPKPSFCIGKTGPEVNVLCSPAPLGRRQSASHPEPASSAGTKRQILTTLMFADGVGQPHDPPAATFRAEQEPRSNVVHAIPMIP